MTSLDRMQKAYLGRPRASIDRGDGWYEIRGDLRHDTSNTMFIAHGSMGWWIGHGATYERGVAYHLAGPFDTIAGAKTALLVMASAKL